MSKFLKRVVQCTTLLLGMGISLAQDQSSNLESNPFEAFNNVKKLGLNLSPRFHLKANAEETNQSIDFKQKNSFGSGVGLDYLILPANKWSLRTGVHLNSFLISDYDYTIAAEVVPTNTPLESNNNNFSSFVLSVPLEIEYKYPIKNNLFLSLRGGFDFTLLQEQQYSTSEFYTMNNEEIEVFNITANSRPRLIYPNLRFSPSVYFVFNSFMLQTGVVYHKNIPSAIKGSYEFKNLQGSGNSTGTYEMSGDYIGMEFIFFLKKKS